MAFTIKEIRSVRVGPFALFDFGGTVLLGVGLSRYTGTSFVMSVLAMFMAGHLAHRATGTVTVLSR